MLGKKFSVVILIMLIALVFNTAQASYQHDNQTRLSNSSNDNQDSTIAKGNAKSKAYEMFLAAEVKFFAYSQAKIEVNNNKLNQQEWAASITQVMKSKLELLTELANMYSNITELNDPEWTVASWYMIGSISMDYYYKTIESEEPYWFGAEDKAAYKKTLSDKANSMVAGSIQAFEKCLETSKEKKIKSVYTVRALEELKILAPQKYANSKITW